MKKLILAVVALLMGYAMVFAQQEINGDLNHDGKIDVTDLAAMSNTILGNKDIEYFDVNKVDNSLIQGPWYITKSNYITFNADGTTDYLGAYKYEYMPYKSQIILYNSDGSVAKVVSVLKLTTEVLILTQDGTKYTTYYRKLPAQLVTSIQLSDTALILAPNSFKTLTATVLPSDADNPAYTWSSSNETVAQVTSSGMVLALAYGKATITATAIDGSGVSAKCTVTVLPARTTYTVNGVSFNMVSVKGGTFQMGATSEQGSDAFDAEKPVHCVTLSDYTIGETEVTQALWYAVMGAKPSSSYSWSSSYGLGDDYPAYYISYAESEEFITKLNALTGEAFRMPTEAEWEYAARGGDKCLGYKYSGSNTIGNVAWYSDNSNSTTHVVATKAPNELGLYDMSGNVWEWCADWYGSYSSDAQTNPTGASAGKYRVYRGGCWNFNAMRCRVSLRGYDMPGNHFISLGLRLAK